MFFFFSPVESATQILILKENCQPKKDNHWIYELLNSFSNNIKLLATQKEEKTKIKSDKNDTNKIDYFFDLQSLLPLVIY